MLLRFAGPAIPVDFHAPGNWVNLSGTGRGTGPGTGGRQPALALAGLFLLPGGIRAVTEDRQRGQYPMGNHMQIAAEISEPARPESDIYNALLSLDDCSIVELGCGAAELTREIASGGKNRSVLALEVDEIQHAENLKIRDLPNVRFELGGAQAIPADDDSVDCVFMFKSLHHVPLELMMPSLLEIRRVLKPGAYAYISEPIFAGDFNDVLRLFHDEQAVREAAFSALQAIRESGQLEIAREIFFNTSIEFSNFDDFDKRVIGATHSNHELSGDLYRQVQERFAAGMAENAGRFTIPIRVDLLRKPAPDA